MNNSTIHYTTYVALSLALAVAASLITWRLTPIGTVWKVAMIIAEVLVILFAGHRLLPKIMGPILEKLFPTA